jgi:hypothetical protein
VFAEDGPDQLLSVVRVLASEPLVVRAFVISLLKMALISCRRWRGCWLVSWPRARLVTGARGAPASEKAGFDAAEGWRDGGAEGRRLHLPPLSLSVLRANHCSVPRSQGLFNPKEVGDAAP